MTVSGLGGDEPRAPAEVAARADGGAGNIEAVEPDAADSPPPVSAAQRSVLYALRRRGEASVEQLAASLQMTVSGARQHLQALAERGLVEAADAPRTPGQRGRTERRYLVAPAAETLFPKAYGELTNGLLAHLPDDVVQVAFERRRDDRTEGARARLATLNTFVERTRELATILDEDGYLASFEVVDDGHVRVTEHNCAILAVAQRHPHACTSEIEFLRDALPDATVERITHMASGDHSCTYEIVRRAVPAASVAAPARRHAPAGSPSPS